jgi:hypothetical protein
LNNGYGKSRNVARARVGMPREAKWPLVTRLLDLGHKGTKSPAHIGPVEFDALGAMLVVRCARELRRTTDPLFRRAGIDLDGEGAQPCP